MEDISADEFERLVIDELDLLPDDMVDGLDNVVFVTEDRPEDGSLDLLGLYDGTALTERGTYGFGELPDRIVLYREPLLAIAEDLDDLKDQIHVTLVHEIAHFYGIDDAQLHELHDRQGLAQRVARRVVDVVVAAEVAGVVVGHLETLSMLRIERDTPLTEQPLDVLREGAKAEKHVRSRAPGQEQAAALLGVRRGPLVSEPRQRRVRADPVALARALTNRRINRPAITNVPANGLGMCHRNR